MGDLILESLRARGVSLSKSKDLPALPARWHPVSIAVAGTPKDVGFAAQGCVLDNVMKFCSLLLSPFREVRPFSNDNERSFWFSVDGKRGSITSTNTGLVISFIAWGISLTIAGNDDEVHIGFAEYPVRPS